MLLVLIISALVAEIMMVDGVVRWEDRRQMIEIERAVRRFKRNPFSSDADLRQKTGGEETEEKEEKEEIFDGSVDEYCNKFEKHFSYYCVGDTDAQDKTLGQFCPSYKKVCPGKQITTESSLISWPTDPFEKPITVTSGKVVTASRSGSGSGRSRHHRRREDSDSEEDESLYYEELRKRYPCKPDCDPRIFPHCTAKCKCDYIYPTVQRFCNPPPMPMFLNTCRLWYHGCPQYERYHYASQFIYSKANKGKVLPGAPDQNNPYNIPRGMPLDGRTSRALALAPIVMKRAKREVEEKVELIIPPPVPEHFLRRAEEEKKSESESTTSTTKSSRKSRRLRKSRRSNKKRRLRRHRYNYQQVPTTARPLTPRELWRALKKINGITSGPGAIGLKSSPATLKGANGEKGGLDGFLDSLNEPQNTGSWQDVAADPRQFTKELVETVTEPKLKPRIVSPGLTTAVVKGEKGEEVEKNEESSQKSTGRARTHQVPILPADSEFAQFASSPADFDGLSDSHGLVHQVRSRSPFTKPGLWEPNPADPHSRDPPNKYWYYPSSVGADWLNGQLQWGGHWAVPAAGVGGTAGMSMVHFPTVGTFLNIPDDYD